MTGEELNAIEKATLLAVNDAHKNNDVDRELLQMLDMLPIPLLTDISGRQRRTITSYMMDLVQDMAADASQSRGQLKGMLEAWMTVAFFKGYSLGQDHPGTIAIVADDPNKRKD